MKAKAVPQDITEAKEIPEAKVKVKEKPIVGVPENTVIVDGTPIEIKPTKLRYVRNGTANFYKLIEKVSLVDIMQLQPGSFGEGDDRDGDKAVMDWLIAATDNEEFVTEHYDDFDVEQILRILDIFKRVNKFTHEDMSKNAETPAGEE